MPTRSRYIAAFRINSADIVNGSISFDDLGNVYTSNVIENGANVYFSNARARAAVGSANSSSLIYYEANGNFQVNVESVGAVTSVNGQTGAVSLTTANIAEGANLYFTNARVWANVGANIGSLHALIDNLDENITSLTTSNVAEGSNLYYTDNRVWANVGANIGNLNAWVSSNSANIGNINSWIPSLTTGSIAEGANLYFTNARVRAAISNVAGISYVESTGVLTLTNTGVVAGTYGNANLIPVITVDAQGRISSVSNVQLYSAGGGGATVDSVNGQTGTVVLTTANIAESGNLYFTTDRVWANIGSNIGNLNSWVSNNSSNIGNLNSWVSNNSSNIGNLNTWVSTNSANIGNLNTWVSSNSSNIGNLNSWVAAHNAFATTTGVAEGSNLYFTNTRVRAAVGAVGSNLVYYEANGNFQVIVTSGGGGSTVDSVNGQTGTVVLTTANIAESGNLYFTNDRVWSNVGANIGNLNNWIATLTTTGIAEGANLYFTNARVRAAVGTAAANATGLSYVENTGSFSLADSGVTAAVYGGATQSAALVVDRYGRITAASNVALSSGSGTVSGVSFTGGLISVANPNTTPALTVAGTSGGVVYFSSSSTWASSGELAASALVIGGGTGAAPSTITTGTGVVAALGVAVGSSGAFVTNGGALGTPSSGTVTNLTGTASININGTVGATTPSTGAFTTLNTSGAVNIGGILTSNTGVEVMTELSGASSTVTHNLNSSAVFYHSSIAGNFTANFTNAPTTNARSIQIALILNQGATPYICNGVQIDGVGQTINWQGGSVPTGTGNKKELINFSLIRTGSSWIVLGALFSHG